MGTVFLEISMSLDGFVAGPNATLEQPLGEGGESLHEWVVATRAWRERHGMEGGEDDVDSEITSASVARTGATLMGRKMFSGGSGPWESDSNANGWWGDEPPFGHPVFVLTHHAREPLALGATTFTFVTEGAKDALSRAREAAGDGDVQVAGGAEAAQQYLRAGLVDEVHLHVAPVFLGGGTRLFENVGADSPRLLPAGAIASSAVTHLTYRLER